MLGVEHSGTTVQAQVEQLEGKGKSLAKAAQTEQVTGDEGETSSSINYVAWVCRQPSEVDSKAIC